MSLPDDYESELDVLAFPGQCCSCGAPCPICEGHDL